MRTSPNNEKIDPLTRIQEEIKEVVRREQEYRQLTSVSATTPTLEYDTNNNDNNNNDDNDNDNEMSPDQADDIFNANNKKDTTVAAAVTKGLLVVPDDTHSPSSTPTSLASSVNSKEESLDEHHSDDSGISASSTSLKIKNLASAMSAQKTNNTNGVKHTTEPPLKVNIGPVRNETRYIGPNCYNMTPEPPQQKLMTRTISSPHVNGGAAIKPRQFTFHTATKGVMQRFIASRGKLQMNGNSVGIGAVGTLGNGHNTNMKKLKMHSHSTLGLHDAGNQYQNANGGVKNGVQMNTVIMSPNAVERDAEGRPIRPGYVPVELKIQRELKDLKSRESELKKIRKIRQSTPDLLDSIEKELLATEDEEDESDVEHCYGPGKLRNAKSISELCEANYSTSNNHASSSISGTPSPELTLEHNKFGNRSISGGSNGITGGGGMRPAMSLAQLCDLDPEEAPSSHRLIAQWESLIQQNA